MKFAQIDVGYTNVGITVGRFDLPDGVFPVIVQTNLLVTKRGRVYEYSEGNAQNMIREWIEDYWYLFRDCDYVGVEKQRTEMINEKERGCLYIEGKLMSTFDAYYQMGIGPKPVLVSPNWWRTVTGVHNRGAVQDSLPEQVAYLLRKDKSVDAFILHAGDQVYQNIAEEYNGYVKDAIEAYWGWYAAKIDWDYLQKKIDRDYGHTYQITALPITAENLKHRIPKEERKRERKSPEEAYKRPIKDSVIRLRPAERVMALEQIKIIQKKESAVKNLKKRIKLDEEKKEEANPTPKKANKKDSLPEWFKQKYYKKKKSEEGVD